jgi:DNA/RNA-binding domain of Phe-tRNA-synthetase-like protein
LCLLISITAICRYLSYIEAIPSRAEPLYAVLQDDKKAVLSVSPVINSQPTRVTMETENVLVEVSSSESMELAQEVALEFLSKFAEAWSKEGVEGGKSQKLQVAPVRLLTPVTDHVRLVFPKG